MEMQGKGNHENSYFSSNLLSGKRIDFATHIDQPSSKTNSPIIS
jgi:hypothetical protein